jgi:lysophospholipase L1-like esterase
MNSYLQWKYKNPLYGKKVSILSDSMSALQGFIPAGAAPSYYNMEKGVRSMWWGQVLDYFGAELLVNSSMADSTIASSADNLALMPSAASDARLFSLQSQTFAPDEIWIFNGFNDAQKAPVLADGTSLKEISCALRQTIQTLQAYFPHASIRVLSLPKALSIYVAAINKQLESVAKECNVRFYDLSNIQVSLDPLSHLDAASHQAIASSFIEDLDQEAYAFITESEKAAAAPKAADPVEQHLAALKRIAPDLLQGSESFEKPAPKEEAPQRMLSKSPVQQEAGPASRAGADGKQEQAPVMAADPVLVVTKEENLKNEVQKAVPAQEAKEPQKDIDNIEEVLQKPQSKEEAVQEMPAETMQEEELDALQEVVFEEPETKPAAQPSDLSVPQAQPVIKEQAAPVQEPELDSAKMQETQVVFKDSPRSFSRKSRNASLIEAIAKEGASDNEKPAQKEAPKEQPVRLSPVSEQKNWTWGVQDVQSGEFYDFSQENMVIGRMLLETDITFKDKNVSRKHASVLKRGNAWYIQDLGSANGTYLNQKPLLANIQYLLQDGDMVRLADKKLKFTHRENA